MDEKRTELGATITDRPDAAYADKAAAGKKDAAAAARLPELYRQLREADDLLERAGSAKVTQINFTHADGAFEFRPVDGAAVTTAVQDAIKAQREAIAKQIKDLGFDA